MIIRKLLASSSAAISKTLQSLIDKLESLLRSCDDNLENDLSDDFETYGEYSEEYEGGDESDEETINNDNKQLDRQEVLREQGFLHGLKALAENIRRDAKGDELLTALKIGFEQVAKNKGQRKAVIFTESTRTQRYVLDLLNVGGYGGQVVLLNGSNNDIISTRVYAEWKDRHKTTARSAAQRPPT